LSIEEHLEQAKKLYHKALEEFQKAKDKNDGTVLRDACGKGWLAAVEATNAIFLKREVKEEELPKTDKGRRYVVYQHLERDLRFIYFSLRESLHIEGYYDSSLGFEEVKSHLDDLGFYIQKVEELKD